MADHWCADWHILRVVGRITKALALTIGLARADLACVGKVDLTNWLTKPAPAFVPAPANAQLLLVLRQSWSSVKIASAHEGEKGCSACNRKPRCNCLDVFLHVASFASVLNVCNGSEADIRDGGRPDRGASVNAHFLVFPLGSAPSRCTIPPPRSHLAGARADRAGRCSPPGSSAPSRRLQNPIFGFSTIVPDFVSGGLPLWVESGHSCAALAQLPSNLSRLNLCSGSQRGDNEQSVNAFRSVLNAIPAVSAVGGPITTCLPSTLIGRSG